MPSRVHFRFHQPAWNNLRFARSGIVGRDMERRGEYVERMARIQVGVDSGALRMSLRHRTYAGKNESNGPYTIVSAGGPGIDYAIMHHEGTRPHEIRPNPPKRVLKFNVGGKTVYATRVNHPGTRENKYLTDHLAMAVRI